MVDEPGNTLLGLPPGPRATGGSKDARAPGSVGAGRTVFRPRSYAERLLVVCISAVVGFAAVAGLAAGAGVRPFPDPALSVAALRFDGSWALARARDLATLFPERSPGSEDKADAAQWLVDQLVSLGYDPQVQAFTAWVGGQRRHDLTNVWAVRRGRSAETIVVHAHYDIPEFVREGACDDASGVGAVLELARVFAAETPNRTLVFAFLDGSEYGLTGAEAFVSRSPPATPLVAAVGLDFLGPGRLSAVSVECVGTLKGYTPPWLRSVAAAAADGLSRAWTPDPLSEWAERSVSFAQTDTGRFLSHGVPAVNLAGVPEDVRRAWSLWHTPDDVAANLDAGSLETWGRVAERVIRSLDERESIPAKGADASMVYLGLGDGTYLAGWALRAGQLLVFAPLWGVVAVGWVRRRRSLLPTLRILGGEARRAAALAACPLAGWVVLKLLRLAGVIPRFELYPATAKDPLLNHPGFFAVTCVVLAVVGLAYVVSRYTDWLQPPLGADWTERHHAFLTLLAVLALVTWLEGAGCAAVSFLVVPALVWPLLPPRPELAWPRRVVGGLLVAAGVTPFLGSLVVLGTVVATGPVLWYLLLAAAGGLVTWKAVVVFSLGTALAWEAFVLGTGSAPGRVLPARPSAY
ncbi:MAG: Zn-dependent exopeptidase M28 [Firmicutes bacterium]|nr:Zn-dependent exopeptidase M28 [Bacillota bacterium]